MHKITAFILSSHMSHVFQPLNIACFSSLQHYYKDIILAECSHGLTQVSKTTYVNIYHKARQRAFQKKTIRGLFRATNIVP